MGKVCSSVCSLIDSLQRDSYRTLVLDNRKAVTAAGERFTKPSVSKARWSGEKM